MDQGGGDGPNNNEAYWECLRNHAASLGSYATDGCGEFTLDDSSSNGGSSLKCAACGCHRNFHRKVVLVVGTAGGGTTAVGVGNHRSGLLGPRGVLVSSGHGGGSSSSRDVDTSGHVELIEYGSHHHEAMAERSGGGGGEGGKKRVRTKFSAEQKEKMLGFAEKLGWRIRRKEGEDDEIERFCRSVGVSRQVFKVWMHNHKSSTSTPLPSPSTPTTTTTTANNASSLTQ
ncbi:hypothetical protein Scep_016259 [Stephania cephalantha]|uniref:ZF-HD dimerization-type domain-containing protein n=1 Tax=Stephania cephalantha TaxID=152367 RepID=A0AAP0NVM0_9MAGN